MIWSSSTGAHRRGCQRTRRRSRGQRSRRCSRAAQQHGQRFPQSSGFRDSGCSSSQKQPVQAGCSSLQKRPLACLLRATLSACMRGESRAAWMPKRGSSAAALCRPRVADFATFDAVQARITRSRIAGTPRCASSSGEMHRALAAVAPCTPSRAAAVAVDTCLTAYSTRPTSTRPCLSGPRSPLPPAPPPAPLSSLPPPPSPAEGLNHAPRRP